MACPEISNIIHHRSMFNNTGVIGLFGGTFDPVHWGHVRVAQALLEDLQWHSIQFIPAQLSPHRTMPIASSQHRLAMLKLATAAYPNMLVNKLEMKRAAPSYTIDTLKLLRQAQPTQSFSLILGQDVFSHFNTWRAWRDILQLVHLVIINRVGLPPLSPARWMQALLQTHETQDPHQLSRQAAGCILRQYIPPIPFSATQIRQDLKAGSSVSHALPAAVLQYIKQQQLYC